MTKIVLENGKEYRLKENVYVGSGRSFLRGVQVKLDGYDEYTSDAWVIADDFRFRTWLQNLEELESPSTKPAHYDTGIDTIAFMRANCPSEQVEGFLRGNALKYLQRYDKKNGVEDLRKAKHYVEMLIEEVEGR